MEYGFTDGISRMWESAKRIVNGGIVGDSKTGYDMSKPKDREIKENLEYADKTPTSEILTGVDTEKALLFVGVGVLVFLALKK